MERILFVCTGNTCRSSMAEGIFKTAAEKDEKLAGKFTAASAGISAYSGDTASPHAIKVLRELWNMDISLHSARLLEKEHIDNAILILTMTRSHKQAICSMFPEACQKVFTLKEFAYGSTLPGGMDEYNYGLDITDPYGMPEQVYKRCAEEIKDAVDKVVERLKTI